MYLSVDIALNNCLGPLLKYLKIKDDQSMVDASYRLYLALKRVELWS